MDRYEVKTGVTGLRNFKVPVPGTDVTCCLGQRVNSPGKWTYSLWDARDELLDVDSVEFGTLEVSPMQVARIAFIMYEYKN